MAILGARLVDRLGQLGAQRIAVEMAGQLVARRQIGQPLHLALLLGGHAQQAGQPFAAPVGTRAAQPHHGQPDRAHRRGRLERQLELRVLRRALLDQRRQAPARFRAQPVRERVAARQALRIGMIGDDLQRTVPCDAVVCDGPIEPRNAGAQKGQAQPLGLFGLAESLQTVGWLLLKRLTHIHHPWPLCGLMGWIMGDGA